MPISSRGCKSANFPRVSSFIDAGLISGRGVLGVGIYILDYDVMKRKLRYDNALGLNSTKTHNEGIVMK